MHQDVFARHLCGEGFPDFYAVNLDNKCPGYITPEILELFGLCKSITDYDFDYDSNGNPLITECQQNNFGMYYTAPETANAFENLYQNYNGLQDKFVSFWTEVANTFGSNPYVIGFDPLNEPLPANMYKDWSLVLEHSKADKTLLTPLYQRLYNEAYTNAFKTSTKAMYFEPVQIPDSELTVVYSVGFQSAPGGSDDSELAHQVLNDHTYCCTTSTSMCATGEPPLSAWKKCHDYHEKKLAQRSKDAARLGVPLLISEFGACLNS
jgi:hypothetical protein